MTGTQEASNDQQRPKPLGLPLQPGAEQGLGRRRFLQLATGTIAGGVLGACSTSPSPQQASALASPSAASTTTPAGPTTGVPSTGEAVVDGTLPIPALLAPQAAGGTKVFRMTVQQGVTQLLPGTKTSTFGFNGSYLGPTLRASTGDRVLIHVTNHLGETTTVHWHGMHLPAEMDGGPMQTIADTSTWSPHFTIAQPAATLWYHPHLMGQTLRQVGMGAVGLFILNDTDPAHADLPHTYGVDDLPLILQAQTFGTDNQLALNGGGGGRGGRGGGGNQATTLVNGAVSPMINTPASRLRLRVLNASSQGIYTIGLAGGETFHQIASDGGLLTAPVAMTQLQLAPAERAEILVDISTAGPVVLQSLGGIGRGRGGDNGTPTGPLLTINSTSTAPAAALPASLAVLERLSPSSAAQTRQFVLGGNDQNPTINGQTMTSMADLMDMSRVLQVKLGTVEIWNLINRSNDTHAFHVHDIQFQILQRDGAPPTANESGSKDTVVVRPDETVRLIMRFADYADPATPYMYHCHLLNHEDNGMMGQFVVV